MWNKSIATASRRMIMRVGAVLLAAALLSNNQLLLVSARSLAADGSVADQQHSCAAIKGILDTIVVDHRPQPSTPSSAAAQKDLPSICNGRCCSGADELYLQNKSINSFVDSLRIQSKEISHKMVETSKVYRGFIAELYEETMVKTINIFSQVYHRMTPVSRQLVEKLFADIKSANGHAINAVMNSFFKSLFPVAYHHVLYGDSGDKQAPGESMDFHEDYKRCLVQSYEHLYPFGDVSRAIARSLERSLTESNMFVFALERGSEVLSSVDQLADIHFEPKCSGHLLKMNFCQDCNASKKVKSCRGYCMNVMRGCLTQHIGSLDKPWTSYAQSLEALVHIVRSKDGYESVLRGLDGRLSEAVMHFMQNGPELEQKVKKLCGTPSMSTEKLAIALPSSAPPPSASVPAGSTNQKRITPPVTEMLQFLVTIDRSKNIYTQIVDSYCDDHEEFQQDDKACWIGDRVGDYSHAVAEPGMTQQKYNPEVPYEGEGFRVNTQVNELVDKLISNRQKMSNVMSHNIGHTDSDGMISDMAEEGSGLWRSHQFSDDSDFGVDGSGSGDGYTGFSKVPIPDRPTYQPPTVIHNPRDGSGGGAAINHLHSCLFVAISVISLLLLRSHCC